METNQVEVKAFHIRGEASISSPTANTGRGRGSGGFKGCSRDRGKGCVSKQKEAQTEGRQNKAHIQCYNCKKYRRYKSQCWQKDSAEEDTKVTHLFMAGDFSEDQLKTCSCWIVDEANT